MKSVADLVALLPELNLGDLKVVQVALDKEMLKHLPIDEDLYFLVFEVTGERPMALSKFFNTSSGIQWRKSQPEFDSLIERLMSGQRIKHITLIALKKFLLEIMVDHIREKGMSLSMRTVSQQLGKIQSIFDRAFPSYLASGLGNLIVKKLEGENG